MLRFVFAFVMLVSAGIGAAGAAQPNIILIMTDDQGYGEMSCHGNTILATPSLDRLHRESARFTDFMVSPTCAPTRASLMTGRHEFKNGVTHTIYERERLSLKATLLAEVLREGGYTTGIFGKWHLGDEEEYQPNKRGFDETFIHGGGGIGQTYPGSCGDAPNNAYFDPAILHNGEFVRTKGYCTDVFFDQARQWIGKRARERRRFFAYITPNAPHDPFISPGPDYDRLFAGKGLKTNEIAYYSMIRNIDENVGKLLDDLRGLEIERETLVIFMTDNGHSIGRLYNAGMRGAKGTVYQGGIRVPSFWRWPGEFRPGDRTQLAAHIDIFPTLAEIAGAEIRGDVAAQVEGRSLLPILKDPQHQAPDRYLMAHRGRWPAGKAEEWKHKQSAIRNERFKLVNDSELYDLKNDPGEARNVVDQHPKVVEAMRAEYNRWWDEVLPRTRANEMARGSRVNPFKERYWKQYGGGPSDELLEKMRPEKKFEAGN